MGTQFATIAARRQIPPSWLEFLDERLAFRRRQAESARLELFHSEVGLVVQPHQVFVATLDFSDQSNSGIQLVDKNPVDRAQLKSALATLGKIENQIAKAAGLEDAEDRGGAGPTQLKSVSNIERQLSKRDQDLFDRIGKHRFEILSNDQMARQFFKGERKKQFKTREAFRSALNRIRRTRDLPSSASVKKSGQV